MQVIRKWFCEVRDVVVPTDDQPVALNELLPSQLKGQKQGSNNVNGGKGTAHLPVEYKEKKGDVGGAFEAGPSQR
jgi:hypothetical protein